MITKKTKLPTQTKNYLIGKLIQDQLGVRVEKDYQFHPVRKWMLDFAMPDYKVALEIEGGAFMKGGGRHTRGKGFRDDLEKYNTATRDGWLLVRILPEQDKSMKTVMLVKDCLKQRGYKGEGDRFKRKYRKK